MQKHKKDRENRDRSEMVNVDAAFGRLRWDVDLNRRKLILLSTLSDSSYLDTLKS